jgi:ferrochelatase
MNIPLSEKSEKRDKSDNTLKGILLLAFGTADSIDTIEPFLKNIIKGRPVTEEMVRRARDRYEKIGGSSPLLEITRAQAKALEKELNTKEKRYSVYVGMRYWHPYIKDTIREMWADNVEEAVAVVMTSHSSRAATGGYRYDVEDALKTTGGVPELRYLRDWHTHPLYIEALTEKIEDALRGLPPEKDVLTIFSAHSLPVSTLSGDPYVEKLKETIREVVERTGEMDHRLAYQSKGGGPVEWLAPEVESAMEEAKAMGKKAVLVVPLGFVSDHVETLYDIDIVFKEKAESLGLHFARAASLNTSYKFIRMLAGLVREGKKVA